MGVEVTVRENDAIRKIKKLMKLADPSRGASDGEIENALRMIDRLMRENNLSMAEVKVEDEDAAAVRSEGFKIMNARKWQKILSIVIANFCDCVSVRASQRGARWANFAFIGVQKDSALARELFEAFVFQIAAGSNLYRGVTDKRSYCEGFVTALHERIVELKNKRATEETGLVFVGKKEGLIKKFLEEESIPQSKTKEGFAGRQTPRAFYHGYDVGNKAALSVQPKRPALSGEV